MVQVFNCTSLLKSLNFNQFNLVDAQCKPDPNFSSVQSANPEDHRAFDQAVELANKKFMQTY